MKIIALVLGIVLVILGSSGIASALPYYEAYSGFQYVGEGTSYDFGFDLWYNNIRHPDDPVLSQYPAETNSNLQLTSDSIEGIGPYTSATLYVDLYSIDFAPEQADITFSYWDDYQNQVASFDRSLEWNGNWLNGQYYYRYEYDFSVVDLGLFNSINTGWGNVNIAAPNDGENNCWWGQCNFLDNDFAITGVALDVSTADIGVTSTTPTPVPEPATMLLLGTGLVGLVVAGRKRKK